MTISTILMLLQMALLLNAGLAQFTVGQSAPDAGHRESALWVATGSLWAVLLLGVIGAILAGEFSGRPPC